MHPIVQRLADLVVAHRWEAAFASALQDVARQNIPALANIRSLADYLHYIDDMVVWAPRESGDSRLVHDKLVEFYFVLNQPGLRALQSPIAPNSFDKALTPLSAWIVAFAQAWGSYLDDSESASHIDSFRTNPAFCWDDYMPPPSGYRTFNQFFARHVKPGRRPVASISDSQVLVSPADATFIGQWPIAADSSVEFEPETIEAKGMRWTIAELLRDSEFAGRFAGGMFSHVALRTFDYHRFHSPVSGRVLEAKIIRGQASLDVDVVECGAVTGGPPQRQLHAIEGTGYQFVQTRGLVVLDSPIGLVACLPVGMAQVSSVVITAEVGAQLRKGEEMGYFQFGGSDIVLVFERSSQIRLTCQADQHFLQGEAIGVSDGGQSGQ
jgi:phosphatidylserine decarboxylase